MNAVYPNLEHALEIRGITPRQLGAAIGLSKHATYRRFHGLAEWKLAEIVAICCYLNRSDAIELFLRNNNII